ncbi:Golgi-associated RAB2 interactor protein 6-like [Anas acuta]|uniref:Golgi-associated RAB2 interactor protein 6-like n=1 Tax=Anas acuta TaxID=28680 RepID=UPI0035C934AC
MSPGPLKRLLRAGEFGLLRNAPLFESNFFQVGPRGEMLPVTNRVHLITMGVACTAPSAAMPDTLLLAAPAAPPAEGLELTRLLPLRCVNLAVQELSEERLQLCFHTGRRVFLQLCPGPGVQGLFLCWAMLAGVLHSPRAPPLLNTHAEGAMPMEGASSTSEIEEDTRAGIVLPTDQESSSAEMDETSPAASTPEVIPEQTCAEHLSSNQDALLTSTTQQTKLVCHRKGDRLREVPAAQKKPSSGEILPLGAWVHPPEPGFVRRGQAVPPLRVLPLSAGRNRSQRIRAFWRRWWAHGRASVAGVAGKTKPPRDEQ